MKYYVYRLDNKIGCTQDPHARITIQQGINDWKSVIVFETDDIIEASHMEAYFKGKEGHKWDGDIYMNFNLNENTDMRNTPFSGTLVQKGTYFQESHLNRENIVEYARDNNGLYFDDSNGNSTKFSWEEVSKLVDDRVIQSSRYNNGFYALPAAILSARERYNDRRMNIIGQNGNEGLHYESTRSEDNNRSCECACEGGQIKQFKEIRIWAENKGILSQGDAKTQFVKLIEEQGELAKAILKNDKLEVIDGLGDTLVVLINLSALLGYRLEDCLAEAYKEIKDRTGKMEDGTFKKD